MYEIEFTKSALDDCAFLKKFEQALILDTSERQLSYEPTSKTRHRKQLRLNDLSRWELRIEKYRVFYDVDIKTKSVKIKAVGLKEHNRLFIRGKEFKL